MSSTVTPPLLNSTHHTTFAYLFLIVACISFYRVYLHFDFSRRGLVVTLFYSLLTFTSLLRSIWFFLFSFSDIYYIPVSITNINDTNATSCLLSQLLSSFGSIGLYLIFILIACYWYQLLKDTPNTLIQHNHSTTSQIEIKSPPISIIDILDDNDSNTNITSDSSSTSTSATHFHLTKYLQESNISMVPLFFICTVILMLFVFINLFLFLFDIFNSEDMIFYDSLSLSVVSVLTLLVLTTLSRRIKKLLIMIGAINNYSTQAQIRRIVAINYAANFFLVCRVGIELSLLVVFVVLYIST